MNLVEPRAALYAWGQRVIALDDLVNDGSYPERAPRCPAGRARIGGRDRQRGPCAGTQ